MLPSPYIPGAGRVKMHNRVDFSPTGASMPASEHRMKIPNPFSLVIYGMGGGLQNHNSFFPHGRLRSVLLCRKLRAANTR